MSRRDGRVALRFPRRRVMEPEMRIVGGQHKGRSLVAPQGRDTRPTADRARESIFNVLAHADWSPGLDGRRVLDLFAGSGALGFEALSRGAAFALFVETDAAARGAIRDNIEALGLFGATRIHRRDATDLGAKPAGLSDPFDLIFLDPPYHKGLGERALAKLGEGGWITSDAIAVFECAADEAPAAPGFETLDERTYGAAKVLFLRAAP
ncbi:16S rRNA (guanine(966)-N(2))-methyltransferase [alpha proteobacterium U9-1i]|nr:16S rRNA (guanine(966)-N(2))-methyltransferase [alpha proteobacterium U9-1i]